MAEKAGLTLEIDGYTEFRDALRQLDSVAKALDSRLAGIDKTVQVYDREMRKYTKGAKQAAQTIGGGAKTTGNSVEQSAKKQQRALSALTRITRSTANSMGQGFRTIIADARRMGDQVQAALREAGAGMQQAGKGLMTAGAIGAAAIAAPLVGSVQDAIAYESSFAGVEKTVSGTAEEIATLRGELRLLATDMNEPTAGIADANNQLNQMAEIAGQLGYSATEIPEFVRQYGALELASNIEGESGALDFARLSGNLGASNGELDSVASTIVALGNNSRTTERDILSMANRFATAGRSAGLAKDEVLALVTAVSSTGIEAEMGGSSLTTFFDTMTKATAGFTETRISGAAAAQHMEGQLNSLYQQQADAVGLLEDAYYRRDQAVARGGRVSNAQLQNIREMEGEVARLNSVIAGAEGEVTRLGGVSEVVLTETSAELEAFARVANVSAAEFATAYRNDPIEAMTLFAEGLSEMSNEEATLALEELGLDAIGTAQLLRNLANDTGLLTNLLGISAEAWDNASAAQEEAQKRLGTTKAQLNVLRNNLSALSVVVGDVFLPAINEVIAQLVPWISQVTALAEANPELTKTVVGAAAGLAALLAALVPVGAIMVTVGAAMSALAAPTAIMGGLLLSPVGVVAGLTALGAAALVVTGRGEILTSWLQGMVTRMQQFATVASAIAPQGMSANPAAGEAEVNALLEDRARILEDVAREQADLVNGAQAFESYTVEAGDTYYDLARQYGVALDDLMAANVDNPNLVIGTEIQIPTGQDVTAQTQDALTDLRLTDMELDAPVTVAPEATVETAAFDEVETLLGVELAGVATFFQTSYAQNLAPGLETLGSGIELFLERIGAADWEGAGETVSWIMGATIRMGMAGTGLVASSVGQILPVVGNGVAGFINRLVDADVEGAGETIGLILGFITKLTLAALQVTSFGVAGALEPLGDAIANLVNAVALVGDGDFEGAMQMFQRSMRGLDAAIAGLTLGLIKGIALEIQEVSNFDLSGFIGWIDQVQSNLTNLPFIMEQAGLLMDIAWLKLQLVMQQGVNRVLTPLYQLQEIQEVLGERALAAIGIDLDIETMMQVQPLDTAATEAAIAGVEQQMVDLNTEMADRATQMEAEQFGDGLNFKIAIDEMMGFAGEEDPDMMREYISTMFSQISEAGLSTDELTALELPISELIQVSGLEDDAEITEMFNTLGQSITDGVAAGMEESTAGEDAAAGLYDTVDTALRDIFGIASPAAEMMPIGASLVEGVAAGMEEGNGPLDAAIMTMVVNFELAETATGAAMSGMVAKIAAAYMQFVVYIALFTAQLPALQSWASTAVSEFQRVEIGAKKATDAIKAAMQAAKEANAEGVGFDIPHFWTGGVGRGMFIAGDAPPGSPHRGYPEIITTDTSMAILNTDTSMAYLAGMRAGSAGVPRFNTGGVYRPTQTPGATTVSQTTVIDNSTSVNVAVTATPGMDETRLVNQTVSRVQEALDRQQRLNNQTYRQTRRGR